MPKVSVIIPSFGRPEFLRKSIQSVIDQTFSDWELLIVDDNGAGSRAQLETQEKISFSLKDSRIRYLIQEKNLGGSAARNRGWKAAVGEYICFLDNDDEFYSSKLDSQVKVLENSGFLMTVCRFESYKNGKKVRLSPPISAQDDYLIPFMQGKLNFASGSTLMISRGLLEKVGGYDEGFRRKQDVELMIRLLVREKLYVSDQVLVRLNIDDRGNIPTVDQFINFQKLFNSKFETTIKKLPQKDQQLISQYDLIELAKVALWNKDWRIFFQTFFGKGLHFTNQVSLTIDLAGKFITYYLK